MEMLLKNHYLPDLIDIKRFAAEFTTAVRNRHESNSI